MSVLELVKNSQIVEPEIDFPTFEKRKIYDENGKLKAERKDEIKKVEAVDKQHNPLNKQTNNYSHILPKADQPEAGNGQTQAGSAAVCGERY